jgi:hypothetical protein
MAIAVYEEHYSFKHGLINNVDTKAKCRHLKKLTCKGALRQVFIRVYRLTVTLVFSTQLCELLLLPFSLVQLSPPPPSLCESVYTYTVCKGKGYGVLGLRQISTCRKVPLQVNFFSWRHFALPSMRLIFLWLPVKKKDQSENAAV